jgi:hypothetical protein
LLKLKRWTLWALRVVNEGVVDAVATAHREQEEGAVLAGTLQRLQELRRKEKEESGGLARDGSGVVAGDEGATVAAAAAADEDAAGWRPGSTALPVGSQVLPDGVMLSAVTSAQAFACHSRRKTQLLVIVSGERSCLEVTDSTSELPVCVTVEAVVN